MCALHRVGVGWSRLEGWLDVQSEGNRASASRELVLPQKLVEKPRWTHEITMGMGKLKNSQGPGSSLDLLNQTTLGVNPGLSPFKTCLVIPMCRQVWE